MFLSVVESETQRMERELGPKLDDLGRGRNTWPSGKFHASFLS